MAQIREFETKLGRYRLLDRIACGGMAEIYRARTLDRDGRDCLVAIKRVLPHLAKDDAFLQMLLDEAKIVAMLHHTNIARLYEFARAGNEYFLALEYVDGKDLRSVIDRCRLRKTTLETAHCVHIVRCVLSGLHMAHEQMDAHGNSLDIVHRDVSPSNIIVAYDGSVKLCDFGIAKATLSRVQTRAGVIKGQVRYMSPEQTRGRTLDRRSDIFSAGSVLYELLALRPAFHAESEMGLVLQVRAGKYTSPSVHNHAIPEQLERIMGQAMARSPAARYQNAQYFLNDLDLFLAQEGDEYNSISLGHVMRDLFSDDVERDLRKLESYLLEPAHSSGSEVTGDHEDDGQVTDLHHQNDLNHVATERGSPSETTSSFATSARTLNTLFAQRRATPNLDIHFAATKVTELPESGDSPSETPSPTPLHSAPTWVFRIPTEKK